MIIIIAIIIITTYSYWYIFIVSSYYCFNIIYFQNKLSIITGSRLTGYIVNLMRSPVIERLMVRGSQVALKHVFHDMKTMTLVIGLRQSAIKIWVLCGDMDRRLKIPHSAKVECGFWTTPEECGLIGLQYKATSYNT